MKGEYDYDYPSLVHANCESGLFAAKSGQSSFHASLTDVEFLLETENLRNWFYILLT